MRSHLVKTAAGSTPSWMLPVICFIAVQLFGFFKMSFFYGKYSNMPQKKDKKMLVSDIKNTANIPIWGTSAADVKRNIHLMVIQTGSPLPLASTIFCLRR